MNHITKTLKETFKPRKRRAAIGGILGPIMIVVIVIAGVGVLAAMFFDLADTASVVDSIEISSQAIYSDQGFVTVQVKNGGNTAINDVYAALLITTVGAPGATTPTASVCTPGTNPLVVTSTSAIPVLLNLDPGESVTISGALYGPVTISAAGAVSAGTDPGNTCTGTTATGTLTDRGEYILQVSGLSGTDIVSKTTTVRAR